MERIIRLGALALVLTFVGPQMASAQTPERAQKMQMEGAKANIKTVHEQELRNHLLQNQAEQKQLQAALQQKQKEQLQMMSDLEKVKAAQ